MAPKKKTLAALGGGWRADTCDAFHAWVEVEYGSPVTATLDSLLRYDLSLLDSLARYRRECPLRDEYRQQVERSSLTCNETGVNAERRALTIQIHKLRAKRRELLQNNGYLSPRELNRRNKELNRLNVELTQELDRLTRERVWLEQTLATAAFAMRKAVF